MKDNYIELTDGTKLNININFGTLYHIQKMHISNLFDKYNADEKLSDDDSMEASALMIYAILRSNGRTVSFDEALSLIPADTDEIKELFEQFKEKLEKYKKKEQAKQDMRKMTQ